MGLINKDERQSVFDFILEKTGAISGLFEFLNKNNLTDVDVPAGEYVVNDVVKEEVVNFFAGIAPEVSIATGNVTILDGTIIAQAKNSNGDVVATKTISLIDNVIQIPDSEISVAGVVLGGLSASTPLNVNVYDQNSNLITPVSSNLAGGVATVTVKSDIWQRPTHWPELPDLSNSGIYRLIEATGLNIFYCNVNKPYNIYVNGVLARTYATANSSVNTLIEIFEEDYTPIVKEGRKWFWVRFDVPNDATTRVSFYTNIHILVGDITGVRPIANRCKNLETVVNLDSIYSLENNDPGAIYRTYYEVEHILFKPNIIIQTAKNLFSDMPKLLHISNYPKIITMGSETFRFSTMGGVDTFDLYDMMTNFGSLTFYENKIFKRVKLINTLNLNTISNVFWGCYITSVEIENCVGVTSAVNAFLATLYIEEVLLWGMPTGFTFNGTYMRESGLLKTIGSLADMTGLTTQILGISGNLALNTIAVQNLAVSKNWTLAFS